MKKKIAVLFLASILAFSAAACNGSSSGTASNPESTKSSTSSVSDNNTDSKTESKADESKSETSSANTDVKNLIKKSYADIVKDGNYYMSMTIDASTLSSLESSSESSSDTPSKITMVVALDSANQKMYVDLGYPMMGFQKIMINDDKQWIFDDTNKVAYYTSTTDNVQSSLDNMTSGVLGSVEDIDKNMKYVSDSVENFNGKDCYAVVYEVKSEVSLGEGVSLSSSSGLSTKQTYYFDKETNKLVGIKANVMGTDTSIVINELTTEIPADLFTVPADYKQTDMSSMMSSASAE